MTALWIVLLVLFLIGMIPVGAWIRYSDGELLAKAALGPIKFKVYPPAPLHGKKLARQHAKKLEKEHKKQWKKAEKKRKKSEEKRRKSEEKRKKAEEKRKGKTQKETGEIHEETGHKKTKKERKSKKKAEKGRKPKKKLSLEELLPMAKLGLKVVGDLPRKLILRELRLHVVCGGADAAKAATGYGRAWTAVGATVPALEKCFRIQKRDVGVALDYGRENVGIDALLDIRMRIGTAVLLALDAGVRFVAILIKNKFKHHKSKGGAAA